MTRERQSAMARCEEARIQYRKVVLASLHGTSNGEAIRLAIREFQRARSELNRYQPAPPVPPPQPEAEPAATTGSWVLRLLKAS